MLGNHERAETRHGAVPKRGAAYLRNLVAVGSLVVLWLLAAVALSERGVRTEPLAEVRMSPLSGFTPSILTVQRGTTVSWVNKDELPHTVTSSAGAFASQALYSGQTFFFRFDIPGTYAYFSGFQPRMTGKIVVR